MTKVNIGKAFAMLAMAVVIGGGSAVAVSEPVSAQPGQPTNCYPVYWQFVNRHNTAPGLYGCPVGFQFARDGGFGQDFINGQMQTSPGRGDNMVVSAYHRMYWTQYGGWQHGISYEWGQSNPYNYDRWLIRLDYNGVNVRQDECITGYALHPCTRTTGWGGWNDLRPGLYRIVVLGCDWNSWTGHTCRQGWTNPIWIWF
jgi:hypothetical protein